MRAREIFIFHKSKSIVKGIGLTRVVFDSVPTAQWFVSHRGVSGSISVRFTRDLWWGEKKWHCDRFHSYFGFTLSTSFHQC